jgi:hypothetical protein
MAYATRSPQSKCSRTHRTNHPRHGHRIPLHVVSLHMHPLALQAVTGWYHANGVQLKTASTRVQAPLFKSPRYSIHLTILLRTLPFSSAIMVTLFFARQHFAASAITDSKYIPRAYSIPAYKLATVFLVITLAHPLLFCDPF